MIPLGILIVLCKPFMLLIIGYILYSRLKLHAAIVALGVLFFLSLALVYDYNVLVNKIYIGFHDLYEAPYEPLKSYLARVFSFFTQRERNRFITYNDFWAHLDLIGIITSGALSIVAWYALNYVWKYDKKIFFVFILSIAIIVLNAAHLRYAFMFYIFAFHFRVTRP